MKILAFDLSTKCIGVVAADVQKNKVQKVLSTPIIPKAFNPETLGYSKHKKKFVSKKGKQLSAFLKPGETTISEAEKKRRDREVRGAKDIFILEQIGRELKEKILIVSPDLILVEKNCIFNGILTTVLLAKVMGVLLGVAGSLNIPVEEYAVNEVRSVWNIAKLCKDFSKRHSEEELKKIPDITKRALRKEMEQMYHVTFLTDDESDACVVFHYWAKKEGVLV